MLFLRRMLNSTTLKQTNLKRPRELINKLNLNRFGFAISHPAASNHAVYRLTQTVALCPPKPRLLDSACLIAIFRVPSGT